jgi:hypothetical protein
MTDESQGITKKILWRQEKHKKHNTICGGYHYTQTDKNNVNKT